ncbi:MAG TPA: sugar phosphate isomerase/epimerase family protein [Kaistia sp.]|nr:sugar phosphate isomerase/epimerase family protein [Kaistia sp.]
MKFGFNLLLWTAHFEEAHLPLLDDLKAAGYDGVEVPIFGGEEAHFAWVRTRLADAGLASTGVAFFPPGTDATSADPAERAAALDHMKWLADCTAALGADLVCGPLHQMLGRFSGAGPTADEFSRCVDVHKEAAAYAGKAGVSFSVEPLNRFECYFLNTADAARTLVDAVGAPNHGYLYDTFHFNIEEKNQPRAIHATAGRFNHVHISENDRGTPGTGPIDFASVFKALKASGYDGWMTVESFGSALPDIAAATRVWRPLFDKPEDVYRGSIKLMKEGWAAA